MANCDQEIKSFLPEVQPTRNQIDGAKRSQKYLRDILCTGQFKARVLDSYLSGSYSRKTAIYPLDDVDIIFLINPDKWKKGIFEKYPDPEVLLKSFHRAIKRRYPDSGVRLQRRSVGLHLNHLDIDVVPAIELNGSDMIVIPDRHDGTWIESAPKLHSDVASRINKEQKNLFKPIVKLLKFWNGNLPATAQLKSFGIETISARLFDEVSVDSLQEGLLIFFDFICSLNNKNKSYDWGEIEGVNWTLFGGLRVLDIAGTESNVTASVDRKRFERFLYYTEASRNKMIEAENSVKSATAWNRVKEALKIK